MALVSPERVFWSEMETVHDWAAHQDRLTARAVRYAAEHSAEARARLEEAGIRFPGDIGLADLAPVRVLAKDDLPELQAAHPPFGGMLAVGIGELRRIYQSPGPIHDPEGRRPDFWRMAPALWAAGFRPGDIVLNTLSYHLTPGGHMLDAGLREVGCVVIPGGVGNSAAQVSLAADAGARGYVGTPQFLLTLLETGIERETAVGFAKALVTGAPLPPDLRARLQDDFEVDVFQAYGTADAGTLGYECAAKQGWHVAPGVVVEVLDPGTGEAAEPNQPGQVVVTSPNDVYPLVRFGTGDLSALELAACSCGRTSPRLTGFLGRVGEGVKVRGMFVHPRQLAGALAGDPEVASYQGVVTAPDHRDSLTVSIEPAAGHAPDIDALAARLTAAVKLRVEVRVVPHGSIEEDAGHLVDAR